MACPKPNTAKQHGVFIISQIKLVKFFLCIYSESDSYLLFFTREYSILLQQFQLYPSCIILYCTSFFVFLYKRTHLVAVVQLYPSCIILFYISFLVVLHKRELILSQQFSIILPVLFFVFAREYFVFQIKFFHSSSFKRVYLTSSTPNQTLTL